MSRALDTETASLLHNDSVQDVYNDISAVLCPEPPSLLEFEFLGKSHSLPSGTNFLMDGNSIAIPKGKLVQSFIYARRYFFEHLRPCSQDKHEELLRATAVILLMDPEHLTAANARKRLLQTYQKGPESLFKTALMRELLFVDSYLTSRLHRHTKSPTLWSHRKWLLELFKETRLDWNLENDLNVVLVAAERHPRNYYAWLHLRWLVQNYGHGEKGFDSNKILDIVKKWCLKHPADTSGFSFLQFYLEHLGMQDESNIVFEEVLSLTKSFKWNNESVWVFLRTLGASCVNEEQRVAFGRVNSILMTANRGDLKATKVLQAAMHWYTKNRSLSYPDKEADNLGASVGS